MIFFFSEYRKPAKAAQGGQRKCHIQGKKAKYKKKKKVDGKIF